MRPTTQGELAADSETELKIRAEVDVALGWDRSRVGSNDDALINIARTNVPYSGKASSVHATVRFALAKRNSQPSSNVPRKSCAGLSIEFIAEQGLFNLEEYSVSLRR